MNVSRTPSRAQGRGPSEIGLLLLTLVCLPMLGATCSGLDYILGPLPASSDSATTLQLAVAIAKPIQETPAAVGAAAVIQWADIVATAGTSVRVVAQRQSDIGEAIGDPVHLIGDGTPGSGRDALADGEADVFNWDVRGVRVGTWVITVTLEAPDGTTATAVSSDPDRGTAGTFTVTTALPIPTLSFAAPGAADVTVTTGSTFEITWTDNGAGNPDALLTLGLDTDADHDGGNEIILDRDRPLSDRDDDGRFTFSFVDENGDPVADGTYTIFAVLDDNANLPVTAEATGQLLLNP